MKMKAIKMITEGFTARQVYVLEQLLEHDRTASEMACDVTSRQSLTVTVDELEKRRLVTRRRCEDDRRAVYISITDAGREVLGE